MTRPRYVMYVYSPDVVTVSRANLASKVRSLASSAVVKLAN